MRALGVALAVSLLIALLPSVAVGQAAPRVVTWSEYRKVAPAMKRARVERIFGAGKGCEYVRYTVGDVLFTGRQYRSKGGATVSIRYRSRDGGVERVRAKQWNTASVC